MGDYDIEERKRIRAWNKAYKRFNNMFTTIYPGCNEIVYNTLGDLYADASEEGESKEDVRAYDDTILKDYLVNDVESFLLEEFENICIRNDTGIYDKRIQNIQHVVEELFSKGYVDNKFLDKIVYATTAQDRTTEGLAAYTKGIQNILATEIDQVGTNTLEVLQYYKRGTFDIYLLTPEDYTDCTIFRLEPHYEVPSKKYTSTGGYLIREHHLGLGNYKTEYKAQDKDLNTALSKFQSYIQDLLNRGFIFIAKKEAMEVLGK